MSDQASLSEYWRLLQERYARLLLDRLELGAPLSDVATYALRGGKRLRPLLAELLGQVVEAPGEVITDIAVAVEYLHVASVLLDDLPCMDDSPTRRGAPSAHRQFSEADVILTAVALTSRSYSILLAGLARTAEAGRAMALLACQTVAGSMALGQAIELCADPRVSGESVRGIHERKTASLFGLVASLVVAGAAANTTMAEALGSFVTLFGRAYQVIDDIEDKNDHGEARANLANVVGGAGATAEARALLAGAYASISGIDRADRLRACVAWLETKLAAVS